MPNDDFPPVTARDARFLFEWFFEAAARFRPAEYDYSVGTSAIQVTSTQRQRVGAIFSNTGAANIAIGFSNGVTITTGILLLPGGTLTQRWFFDSDLLIYPMWAISSGGGSTLHVVESALDG